jgi:biopolymer transport protein ExbD
MRRRLTGEDLDEPRLEIMPLIDVIFLLLTFFIFSVAMMVRADALDVRLPSVRAGESVQRAEVVSVTVLASGEVRVMGEAVTLEELGARVAAISEEGGEEGGRVLVAADERAPSGALLRALDALARAGLVDVGVIGRPEGE